ncbi:hypothetical protein HRG_008172 [Hirsutella rhossiliensis]|uniref:Tse2 ADP-ribosyltransferase toxin domain-containing protein n=1 Tax=Hirsutella rhossiliensis TaxID=111463 RepID=A0A9P8MV65_9HYPO|nr:uncharacterized protein HRG_08172 [Hirsutella rhossiliensis]KAH0961019.1 hypothetical protein HRG_08172 [Hirsutella rhossiliensis]
MSASNGAIMFPNTFMMQELVRTYFDQVLDGEEQGNLVDMPSVYTIPKGTRIPSHLILINEYTARFSLQPSRGMPLKDLNQALDEFYAKHAHMEAAEKWLDAHPFQDAIPDDADAAWTAK